MRHDLLQPVNDEIALRAVIKLAREAYMQHETAQDNVPVLRRIAAMAHRTDDYVHKMFTYAFGSVRPETFAQKVLVDWDSLPRNLTKAEMLELVERIFAPKGQDGYEFLCEYWIRCLEVNTGNELISDIIFWPDQYFRSSPPDHELSPREVLDRALADAPRRRK